MPRTDIPTLNAELQDARAGWVARQTPQSQLSDDAKRALLGAEPSDAEINFAAPAGPVAATFAPAVDWRNHNGITSRRSKIKCAADLVSHSAVPL